MVTCPWEPPDHRDRRAHPDNPVILEPMELMERSDSRDSMVKQVTQENKENRVMKESEATRELKATAYLATWETKGPRVNVEDLGGLLMGSLVAKATGAMWVGPDCVVTLDCVESLAFA
ncbi:hypothetical protein AAFF_G00254530 [Aldrovandia affinis]|uniref:Uncharacterized protein n=1 Tax=Aldrovandia affinis TaxID=143900 RepID=A0AAD7W2F2_9TELE|nr:hypothetical protein AAFF_G00254530 [Aldrovandia affinis]